METKDKKYETPEMDVIELLSEGVLCASGDTEEIDFLNGEW